VYHPYVPFSMAAPAPGSRTRNSWRTISTYQFMRSRPIDSPLDQSLSSEAVAGGQLSGPEFGICR
jgi:hypothetical protein